MTIKEIESRTGLPRANIRYYESQGFIAPVRGENGYRDYRQEDLDTLLKVKLLRQLHFSLEEIRALQQGQTELAAALAQKDRDLEAEQAALSQAARMCRTIRADGVSYATLEALHYLEQLDRADFLAEDQLPHRFFTWRRYFARSLDLTLYSTLISLVLQIFFRKNTFGDDTGLEVLTAVLSLCIMLAAETAMLHRWGATPGKALFGLRILREDGSCLSVSESFNRTGLLTLFWGFTQFLAMPGVLVLSLVSLAMMIWAFWRTCKKEPLPWETEEQVYLDGSEKDIGYWSKGSSWLKLLGFGLCHVACVALLVFGHFYAMTPEHHGPGLTREQFVENYNQFCRFQNSNQPPDEILTVHGVMEYAHIPGAEVIRFERGVPPVFTFTEEEGRLTAVTFTQSLERGPSEEYSWIALPLNEMEYTLWAFLGGQKGIGPLALGKATDHFRSYRVSTAYTLPGAEISSQISYTGYKLIDGHLLSADGEAHTYFSQFTIVLE